MPRGGLENKSISDDRKGREISGVKTRSLARSLVTNPNLRKRKRHPTYKNRTNKRWIRLNG